MADRWNIIIAQGATYESTITITGVSDIASATEWRLIASFPNQEPFLTATTNNGLIVAGTAVNSKVLRIPAATTATYATGNGKFDFEVLWSGGIVRRYQSNGFLQVNPAVDQP